MSEKAGVAVQSERLVSLDVFRGATIAAMMLVNNPGTWSAIYPPLRHADWHGWTFTDLVFPFFLYIVGVAIVYAFSKKLAENTPKITFYPKLIRRTLILFGLGLFLNGFPFIQPYFDFATWRIPGVLQRIAICYFFTSVIFLHSGKRGQWAWAIGLLLAYWALMEWIPVPGVGAGLYDRGANFSAYIDQIFLEGHMWSYSKTWDPEGIISTLPAISTTLFGVLTGHLLRSEKSRIEKTLHMFLWGNFALWLGIFWNYFLPINKNIWTSSYTVFMAGLALIVLAFCYYLTDVKGYRRGIKPLIVYGVNAIAVYVMAGVVARLTALIKFTAADGSAMTLKDVIYDSLFASWLSPINASLAYALLFVALMLGFNWLLFWRKIFIKI
jgi:predicted acyltransferase